MAAELALHPRQPLGIDEVLKRFYSLESGGSHRPLDMCGGSSAFDCRSVLGRPLVADDSALFLPYGDPQGRIQLREMLSARYRRTHGVDISPERFCITDGASGGLHAALAALLEPGNEVLVPEITFPVFKSLVHLLGARSVPAPIVDPATYDAIAVERAVSKRAKAIIINSPNNPLGAVLSRAQLEHIASLGLHVISDEVYAGLSYGKRPTSILEVTDDAFVLGSFSKEYGACGVRLGYVIVPERFITSFLSVKATFNVSTSMPSQLLGEQLLAKHDEIIAAHVAFLRERREATASAAREHGIKASSPTGGYYTLVDIQHLGIDSLAAALDLLATRRIALAPGTDFAPADPRFLRFNFARPTQDIAEAFARLADYATSR